MALNDSEKLGVVISVLGATGQLRELKSSLLHALSAGTEPQVLREILLQTYLFAGYPRAINALMVLREAFEEHGFHPEDTTWIEIESPGPDTLDSFRARGEELCRTIYGDSYEKLMENMNELHPEFARWILEEGYGKVLSRSIVAPKLRELCVVGILTVFELDAQLMSHLQGAIRVGAEWTDLEEAIYVASSYVPESRPRLKALDALQRAREKIESA
jgi:4-carboxymuconolactone decarboxylase